ncbi:hypothetical protein PO77_19875, partial [Vibrio parahaemolyticus]
LLNAVNVNGKDGLRYFHKVLKNKGAMEELMEALRSNFEGHEDIYNLVKNKTPKYGNDDDYADEIMKEVFDAYYNEVNGRPNGR